MSLKTFISKTSKTGEEGIILKKYRALEKIKSFFVSVMRLLILCSIGYVVLYPLMYMITSAIRTGESYYDPTITWLTSKVTVQNFKFANEAMRYFTSLKNTVFYELVAALLQLISCAIVAYGFARFDFKEKKFLIVILFITIMLPVQATMLPSYVNYSHLDFLGILGKVNEWTGVDLRPNITNGPLAFWLPSFFGVGLRSGIIIFIYTQFFKGLPRELEEAAWIDGSGPINTFIKIAIPSSSVVIFTNLIFSFIWHWNDYYLAAMYLKDKQHFTLAVSLGEVKNTLETMRFSFGESTNSAAAVSVIMASCVLYVLPMLIMYIFVQSKFVKSIDRVGITG